MSLNQNSQSERHCMIPFLLRNCFLNPERCCPAQLYQAPSLLTATLIEKNKNTGMSNMKLTEFVVLQILNLPGAVNKKFTT